MHRTDGDSNIASAFTDGDPTTGTPGTKVEQAWLNAVQEELCNLIEAAGITLVKGTHTQLLAAAVAAATANRIVRRDAAGRAQVVDPSAAADIATKGYIDGKFPALSWTALTPSSPFTAWGANPAGYFKDAAGIVHLKGALIAHDTTTRLFGVLPSGHRPSYFRMLQGIRDSASSTYVPTVLYIETSGNISLQGGAAPVNGEYFYFDAISFVGEA